MGIALTVLTLIIIFGGIQRVAKFSSTVVPVMAVVYLLVAIGVVVWNITSLPKVLLTIVRMPSDSIRPQVEYLVSL